MLGDQGEIEARINSRKFPSGQADRAGGLARSRLSGTSLVEFWPKRLEIQQPPIVLELVSEVTQPPQPNFEIEETLCTTHHAPPSAINRGITAVPIGEANRSVQLRLRQGHYFASVGASSESAP